MPSGLGALAGAAASVWGSSQQAKAQKKAGQQAAALAAEAQAQRQRALEQAQSVYNQGLGYHQSFLDTGQGAGGLNFLNRFFSDDPEQQALAMAQYQSSPLGQLFAQNRENAARQVAGYNASRGGYHAGNTMADLVNRTSAVDTQGILSYLSGINQNVGVGQRAAALMDANRSAFGGNILKQGNLGTDDRIGGGIQNINAGLAGDVGMARGITQAIGMGAQGIGTAWNNYLQSPNNPNSWNTTTTPAPGYDGPGAYTSWGTTVTPANNYADLNFWPG